MLSTVVRVVAETVQCDACSVFLYDAGSDTLMLRATVGLNQDIVRRLTIRSDAGITGLAAAQRQTQFALDARASPGILHLLDRRRGHFTSQLSIPLLLREPERLVGVMNIQTLTRARLRP